jgi:AcrR family transcriptional regulator
MTTSARLLRAAAKAHDPAAYTLSEKQRAREERIRATALHLFARFGTFHVAFRDLAIALRMGTATLRFHFVDRDALLADLLNRHLRALQIALAKIPANSPDLQKARREAYRAFITTTAGTLSDAHTLLVRDACLLPADERDAIERIRARIGEQLAGTDGAEILHLLDNPVITPARVEAYLALCQLETEPERVSQGNPVRYQNQSPVARGVRPFIGAPPPAQPQKVREAVLF